MLTGIRRLATISRSETKLTVFTALFVCLGIIVPYVSGHAYGLKGNIFLPMHLPVILCGMYCGGRRGMICGILTPLLSSLLTNMPATYPMLPIMLAELSTYGMICGILTNKLRSDTTKLSKLGRRDNRAFIVMRAQIIAMICGRISYAIMFYILLLQNPSLNLTPKIQTSLPALTAILQGIPGMIIQLTLILPLTTPLIKLAKNDTKTETKNYY